MRLPDHISAYHFLTWRRRVCTGIWGVVLYMSLMGGALALSLLHVVSNLSFLVLAWWVLGAICHEFDVLGLRTKEHTRYGVRLENGDREWRDQGLRLHRVGGPAFIRRDGTQVWHERGQMHRVDGPARTYPDGSEQWYRCDELHRVDGPATTAADGSEQWYFRGKLHRVDGPAVTANGNQQWYQHGRLHREDGPAIIHFDGHTEWWIDGEPTKPRLRLQQHVIDESLGESLFGRREFA